MAIIHNTTMNPGKLDLLAAWLPGQPWYLRTGRDPELAKIGGFRLDDPEGAVGIEFMLVADQSGAETAVYQVPLTYRGQPLDGADSALIGTSEHGVLGLRWIYDGTHDPVLAAQLVALIQGDAQPQAQSISGTPDPAVTAQPVADPALVTSGPAAAASGPDGTDLQVPTADADGAPDGQLMIRVLRVLRPGDGTAVAGEAGQPCLSAPWRLPDGTHARGVLATALYTRHPAPRS
jgi:hypothetical protein